MISIALMTLSAAITLLMGTAHLVFTFTGPKFLPRDAALKARMQEVAPVISKDTTIWKCWIGFNASHSMGVMLFGLFYGYLALAQPVLLFHSPFLLCLGIATLLGFVSLARAYWFYLPLTGISLSLGCYVSSVVISLS